MSVPTCTGTLSRMDLYTQLALDTPFTEGELSALEGVGDVTRFPAGSILMGEGELTDFALLIRKGHTKVVSGIPQRIIAIRGPGEIVGEMAAILKRPRSASIFSLDDVESLYLSAAKWLAFLNENSRAALAQVYATQKRIAEATEKVVQSLLGAEQKLAKSILELESKGLGHAAFDGIGLRFSQQDLASIAGVSLDSVKQVIRSFKARGIVATRRQMTIVRDLNTLQMIARGDSIASI